MYTPTTVSIHYERDIQIGLRFDVSSFNLLVESCVDTINGSIKDLKAKIISKDVFVNKIGLQIEMIEYSVFLGLEHPDIKIKGETKTIIKKLLPEVEELIRKLGETDYDWLTMSSTQRARPKKKVLEYISKKKRNISQS